MTPRTRGKSANQGQRADAQRATRSDAVRHEGTLIELTGLIEDVRTIDRNDAWLVVRPVDGLADHIMATATIPNPRVEIDEALENAGRDGRITLVGISVASSDRIPKLRMTEVHTVNGIPTARPAPSRPALPSPTGKAPRWWQRWRNNETNANAQ